MAKIAAEKKAADSQEIRINEQKWGRPLMQAGWTCLPNTVFLHQSELGLNSTDVNILLHLLSYWWEKGELPHPSKARIAKAMNLDPRTVQRRIAEMEKRQLIERVSRNGPHRGTQTNIYKFDGLIEKATELAKVDLKIREERNKQSNKEVVQVKPTLTVVS